MPEIVRKIENGNQKSNLMPEIVRKIENGNQKSNLDARNRAKNIKR
ncbi:hypothetical protein PY093_19545 [Cytobacillus sp. S13-E01]|nr:hypothetical protein [Cytobacillus sp. S13-E01]MDF0728812.1 hypothetical protein [Cytobacillus sp. S13-E01]